MRAPVASHCTGAESDVTSREHLEQAMIDRRNGLTYADSGVDIDAGNRLVDLIKPMVRATARAGADAEIGGVGGVFDVQGAGLHGPGVIATTDCVRAKSKNAVLSAKHDRGRGGVVEVAVYGSGIERPQILVL